MVNKGLGHRKGEYTETYCMCGKVIARQYSTMCFIFSYNNRKEKQKLRYENMYSKQRKDARDKKRATITMKGL